MSDVISRLFSSSFLNQHSTPPSRVLHVRPSSDNPDHIVIHQAGPPAAVPPLYTISASKSAKPNILIFRGTPDPGNVIGNASFNSLLTTVHISLHGQSMRMTLNQFSGNFTIKSPRAGKLKWIVGKILGSSLELRNTSAMKLACMRSNGFPGSGERKLEIFVPCDDAFVDLLVLSGIAAKALMKQVEEVAGEVAEAVAGI